MNNSKKSNFQEINATSVVVSTTETIHDELDGQLTSQNSAFPTHEDIQDENKNYIVDDYMDNGIHYTKDNSVNSLSANLLKSKNEVKIDLSIKTKQLEVSNVMGIDLSEAEAIANEEIIFLSEDDLVEALEDSNLIEISKIQEKPAEKKKLESTVSDNNRQSVNVKSISALKIEQVIQTDMNLHEIHDITTKKIHQRTTDNIIEESVKKENDLNIDEINTFTDENQNNQSAPNGVSVKNKKPIEHLIDEIIPVEISTIENNYDHVIFSDDKSLSTRIEKAKKSVYDLDKISLELDDNIEGKGLVFIEADIESDKELRSDIYTPGITFEDLLFDFEDIEYKYRDDELNYIDSAIIQDDYSQYIREIDEFYGLDKQKNVSSAAELFKLTPDEFQQMEKSLFNEEYSGIDLSEMFDLVKTSDKGSRDSILKKSKINYIVPDIDSLSIQVISSIEDDLSEHNALVYEEDVEVIKKLLKKPVSIVLKTDNIIIRETEQIIAIEKLKENDEIANITDQIVILEDSLDVDRFIKTVPDRKQIELKRLLKYLDGLFEKLPESAIKTFVDSEYFDLYVKILNEIGD